MPISQTSTDSVSVGFLPSEQPWWLWPNLLSLDAPLVAVVWLWAFSRETEVKLAPTVYAVLALAVWTIYVADRLMDAKRMPALDRAPMRHRFYARHFWVFCLAAVMAAAGGMVLAVWALPLALLLNGLVVAVWVGAYLWKRQSCPLLPKEMACGLLFAAGTLCPLSSDLNAIPWLPAVLFALLCAANCVVIARRERECDRLNDPGAITVRAPVLAARLPWLLWLVAGAGLATANRLGVALALAAAGLWLLGHVERRMRSNLHRVLADAALLTPLVVMPW